MAVDRARRSPEMRAESGFLFLVLKNLERVPDGWALEHLERWDAPGTALDAGALGNQTSPLYVAET